MTHVKRLTKEDTLASTIAKLADGNSDAARIIADILLGADRNAGVLATLFALTAIQQLDVLGIYGDRLVIMHAKVALYNTAKTAAVLDCFHSKILTAEQILDAVDGDGTIDLHSALEALETKTRGFHAGYRSEIFARAA